MLLKLSFYDSSHDSAQNGVLSKKIVMSLQPVRSNIRKFQTVMDFMHLFWDEERVWQAKGDYLRETTTNCL